MLLPVVKFSFFFYPQGPPRVSERVNHRQSARLGRTVKLPCPVEGDPPPLIMWTKDGRNIHRGWTRFRVSQHALRIKEVEMDDAGTYICKATNGFGSVNVNYTLIVIGKCFVHETSMWTFGWIASTRKLSGKLRSRTVWARNESFCASCKCKNWVAPVQAMQTVSPEAWKFLIRVCVSMLMSL